MSKKTYKAVARAFALTKPTPGTTGYSAWLAVRTAVIEQLQRSHERFDPMKFMIETEKPPQGGKP